MRPRHGSAPRLLVACLATAALASARAASAAPPTAPTPVSPPCGSEVTSFTPTLTVDNAVDPQGSPLVYQFQLYRDAGLTLLFTETTDRPEGAGATTSWPLPVSLAENTRYFWRARARNPSEVGPYSAPACAFFVNVVNEPPGAPRINAPAFGAQVNTFNPTLRVDNAIDPDEDVLRYQLELFSDPALSTRVAATAAAGVAEGAGGTTSWLVNSANPALMEDRFYYWRARACDPDNLCGPWSASGEFFVSVTNAPPEPPAIVSPRAGSIIDTLRPPLVILNATDADLDPLVYDWDLAAGDLANPIRSGANDPPTGGQTTTFSLGEDLQEDHRYCWRVRSDDGQAVSAFSAACFFVSVVNDPPSVPVLVRPSDDLGPTDPVPIFAWEPSTDPEGEAISYDVEVKDAGGSVVGSVTGTAGTIAVIGPALAPSQTYTWRARAVDRTGLASAWSPEAAFTVEGAPAPDDGCCDSEGGCQATGGADPGGAIVAGVALVTLGLARRRRSRPTPPVPCR